VLTAGECYVQLKKQLKRMDEICRKAQIKEEEKKWPNTLRQNWPWYQNILYQAI